MQQVPAPLSRYASQQRHAQERQVTDDVQNLVTDKLVGKAQPRFIQHAVSGQDDGVIERSSANQVRPSQCFNLLDKSKRPGRSDVPRKRTVIQGDPAMLQADEWVREINNTIDLITFGGLDADPPVA